MAFGARDARFELARGGFLERIIALASLCDNLAAGAEIGRLHTWPFLSPTAMPERSVIAIIGVFEDDDGRCLACSMVKVSLWK